MREKIAEIVSNQPICHTRKCVSQKISCTKCRGNVIDALEALLTARTQAYREALEIAVDYVRDCLSYETTEFNSSPKIKQAIKADLAKIEAVLKEESK